MGSGSYSTASYASASTLRAASGLSDMGYTDDVMSKVSYDKRKVHADLDPKGVTFRESRDSDEHPNALPIACIFDVTGSMGGIPRIVQQKLPTLLGLILLKGYTEDPQVLFGGVGDAFSDRGPLQVGQFESDNRLDDNIMNLWLEGGGGGGNHESYELAMYFMARHTVTDAWEKRGKKGYLFLMGDECSYDKVTARQVREIIGDEIDQDIPIAEIITELQEKWEVYFILPADGPSYGLTNKDFWTDLFGQCVLVLDDSSSVAELIAATVGIAEGRDLSEIEADLKEVGVSAKSIAATTKAVSKVTAGTPVVSGTASGTLPDGDDLVGSGTSRL